MSPCWCLPSSLIQTLCGLHRPEFLSSMDKQASPTVPHLRRHGVQRERMSFVRISPSTSWFLLSISSTPININGYSTCFRRKKKYILWHRRNIRDWTPEKFWWQGIKVEHSFKLSCSGQNVLVGFWDNFISWTTGTRKWRPHSPHFIARDTWWPR